jgi:biopolymer transport protein ExbB
MSTVIERFSKFMEGQTGAELVIFWILVACSVLELAVVLERFWTYGRLSGASRRFKTQLKPALETGRHEEVRSVCQGSRAPLAAVLSDMGDSVQAKLRPEQTLMLLRQSLDRSKARLTKFLAFLATLAGTAPFIGLFGTVLGIMHTFSSIADQGFGGPAVVSAGISAALIATAAGLGVAIPAVIFYNIFVRKVNSVMKQAEAEATQILIMTGRL